jgi:very-short-patch-repair endonuclease
LVIELDDASHEEETRRDLDTFVDAALNASGLPILHIPANDHVRLAINHESQ